MQANEYQCSCCKRVFEKDWSDEEAAAELKDNFPGATVEQCSVVCDDCWKEMNQ